MKIRTWTEKESTWAELKALAEAGKLGEVLKSGDNIPVMLKNGEEVSFDIGKDESGKIYFVMHNCLKETKPMNRGCTNKGGWEECEMRKYLNEEVIKLLPDELQEIIKPTKIVQIWDGKRRETEDKLFLLSRTQIFGKNEWYESIEPNDSQIDIFENPKECVKRTHDYEASCYWWLLSPHPNNITSFFLVGMDGMVSYDHAYRLHGVVPAFCI